MIKFNKYNVTDTNTKKKARIFYSLDNHASHKPCVTLYAKDFTDDLGAIVPDQFIDNTDITTDYVETGHVNLFESHPLYGAARTAATK